VANDLDPLFRNSLREARLILAVWLLAGVATITICYLFGYLSHEPDVNSSGPDLVNTIGSLRGFDRTPESLTTPLGLGIPDWKAMKEPHFRFLHSFSGRLRRNR